MIPSPNAPVPVSRRKRQNRALRLRLAILFIVVPMPLIGRKQLVGGEPEERAEQLPFGPIAGRAEDHGQAGAR